MTYPGEKGKPPCLAGRRYPRRLSRREFAIKARKVGGSSDRHGRIGNVYATEDLALVPPNVR